MFREISCPIPVLVRLCSFFILIFCLIACPKTAFAANGTEFSCDLPETPMAGFAIPMSVAQTENSGEEIARVISSVSAAEEEEEEPEEEEEEEEEDPRAAVLDHYENLGVVSDVNNYLNVREEPDLSSSIIGKILKNGGVEIIEDTGTGWYQITSEEVTGYVSAEFILTGEEAEEIAVEQAKEQLVVTADCLNVRKSPDTESSILTQISKGERYDIVETEDGWTKIAFGLSDEGEELYGYVNDEFTTIGYYLDEAVAFTPVSEEDLLRGEIVDFAMQYLGGAYVWGGTKLGAGVDCSGFMQSVYKNFGIRLNRTSREQVNNGVRISESELRPGDLVFYATHGGNTISHVAMYIGNGQIIHACSPSRGIIISSLHYWTPVACVNVIGD